MTTTDPRTTDPTTTDPSTPDRTAPGPAADVWDARAIGDQPAWRPDALRRFVADARIALLSYVRADGRPGQAPIWYVESDGVVHLNVATGSPKHRALLREPRVCVTIQDERPPYRAVVFDAVAELTDQPERSATEGIEERYLGRIGGATSRRRSQEHFEATGVTETTLRPTDVRGFDNTRDLNALTVAFLRVRPHLPLLRRLL
ncbi:MAG: pyridoxamine 5'-phosphate oxidase family protein [Microthrixaceae bacterium]